MTDQKKNEVKLTQGKVEAHTDGGLYFRDVHNYVWQLIPTNKEGDPFTLRLISQTPKDSKNVVETIDLDPLKRASDSTLSNSQQIKPAQVGNVQITPASDNRGAAVNAPGQMHNPAPNAPQPSPELPARAATPATPQNLQPQTNPRVDPQDKPGLTTDRK